MVADNLYDPHLCSAGNRLAICDGWQLLHRALEGVLYASLATSACRDAQIDVGHLTHALFDAECTVVLEVAHLLVDEGEDSDEEAADEQSCGGQQEGIPDEWSEADAAPPCTEQEIDDFCRELPRYKRPRKVIFAEVPRNPTGKIEKPKLRKMYCGESLVAAQNEINL